MDKILTKEQVAVLKLIGANNHLSEHFYLTSGTPLAAFYLQHRYSEDLDFFPKTKWMYQQSMRFFQDAKQSLGFTKIDSQTSYNRIFFSHIRQ